MNKLTVVFHDTMCYIGHGGNVHMADWEPVSEQRCTRGQGGAVKFGPTPGLFETIVAWYNSHKSEPVDGVAALRDAETAESSESGHTVADPVIPEAVIPVANQPVIITMEQMKVLSALSVLVYVLYIMC